MSDSFTFSRKFKAAAAVFVFLFITIPYLLFQSSEKFIGDKKPLDWLAEKGWWSMTGLKLGAIWFVIVAVVAAFTYFLLWCIERLLGRKPESEPKLIIRVKNEWIENIEHINKEDPFIYHQSKIRLTKDNDGYHAWADVLVVFDNQRSEAVRVEGVFVSIVIPNRDEVDLVGECRPDYDGLPNRLQGERIDASTLTHTYHGMAITGGF